MTRSCRALGNGVADAFRVPGGGADPGHEMVDVLVVDDDVAQRAVMRRVLEAGGHSVREAENGRRGIDAFRAQPADVVVTDILMPEADGLELVIALRRSRIPTRVLAVSGGGLGDRQDYLECARQLGAHATLQKPFGPQQLRDAVARLLE